MVIKLKIIKKDKHIYKMKTVDALREFFVFNLDQKTLRRNRSNSLPRGQTIHFWINEYFLNGVRFHHRFVPFSFCLEGHSSDYCRLGKRSLTVYNAPWLE